MALDLTITPEERVYLRELAHKQAEYAALPIMAARKALWYAHNALTGPRPIVVMEMDTFEPDMIPTLRCASPAAREIERNLLRHIVNHECIDDDKVVPDYYTVYWQIELDEYGVPIPVDHATDAQGRSLGYTWRHPIKTLREDFGKLKPATFSVDRAGTDAWQGCVEDVLGDILPVKRKNRSFWWHAAPSGKVVALMGLQAMMLSMVDEPDEMHALYAYLRDNILAFARWQQAEGLLTLNNENDYAGAGSYGFTHELPQPGRDPHAPLTLRDLWLNLNSQETVGVSPRMYHKFIFPYYRDMAAEFGLVYYGCCEPVHDVWERSVSQLPNLRKVSISAWCNEEYMGEALRGSRVIYSRKPSPNFIGVGATLDEDAFRQHIRRTLAAARGCHLEFIFRDVYTLSGDTTKAGRAVQITRELIEAEG